MQINTAVSVGTEAARAGQTRHAPTPVVTPPKDDDTLQMQLTQQRVRTLKDALAEINDILHSGRVPGRERGASVSSAEPLGLDYRSTPAELRSREDVNTTRTSYTPAQPAFTLDSTATATVEGDYDGSNGSGPLTFQVLKGGEVARDDLAIRVFDTAGDVLSEIRFAAGDVPGTTSDLGNGLTLSLGPGRLQDNAASTIEVSDRIPSSVRPDNPLNGTGDQRPGLDPGQSVTAGTLVVDGQTVTVAADDSLRQVVEKIDAAAPSYTAVLDSEAARIQIRQHLSGSSPTVSLGPDTSGFLAAVKLEGATVMPGRDADNEVPLAVVAAFSQVRDGQVTVNGQAVPVNPREDTLNALVQRINDLHAGVTAGLVDDGQRLLFRAEQADQRIELSDDGTGLLAALRIAPGSYGAEPTPPGQDTETLASAIARVADAVNGLATAPWQRDGHVSQERLGFELREAVAHSAAFDSTGRADTGFGLTLSTIADPLSFDAALLNPDAPARPAGVYEFFFGRGTGDDPGFAARVMSAVNHFTASRANEFGSVGLLLDIFA